MPDSRMIYKAGKLSFLLVCLFLCTACGVQPAVFESGEPLAKVQEKEINVTEKVSDDTKKDESQNLVVNINTADAAELMTLPGIGKVRAAAIIEYRQQMGDFEKFVDIMYVKGIKTGIFSKINSLICVK